MSRPRLTVRARLTLLYTGLFAVCGAIVVAVSYTLVARLRAQGQGNGQQPSAGDLARFAARCRSEELSANPDARHRETEFRVQQRACSRHGVDMPRNNTGACERR